jgi:hypothetical protein
MSLPVSWAELHLHLVYVAGQDDSEGTALRMKPILISANEYGLKQFS